MAQSNKWQDITLAAAGTLQATALVDQLARTGFIPSDAYHCSINSLFQTSPTDTLSVYGELANLRLGLETWRDLLQSNRQLQNHTVRYSAGVLHLQGRLRKRKDMLQVISSRIDTAKHQAGHFGSTHDNVIANLADIYSDTLSRFRFRIQVAGEPTYLQQKRVANQVRALLLASVRSAMLWRQVGGSRLQILLQRKRLLAEAERLLQQIPL
ncbi:high frequency lysogenization protein HflD [Gilvimarinus agarilyticus]|uniref:high frequency lysogenization protein HflD n=1 Tax=unclassified Gilvimarinus TaxID=2642066 RepID=UPI001C08BAC1|nr:MULTISPECIES: high frequency lysogenization protein HflD [unclassified Gilvimarinus]MBU2886416.1 high frequency lysogenization protein HflD [Gilvimarinus agarilyticus]MDO6571095.1 high frequency lysogenization protein HflD [Gilvimarinus sp. 2_MG-2023]MDO6745639.1 high frequency lysogenization protein HflD [Gilvimarinus sp. 1_MG-2023]